jgi:hypothetical protein
MSADLHFKKPRTGFKRLRSVGTEAARGENQQDASGKAASPSLARRLYNRYCQLCVAWGTITLLGLLIALARAA